MSNTYLFTSESVSEGHPDKICDQVSDAVLDEILSNEKDPKSCRVACECFATTGLIIVGGEIRTETYINLQKLVRSVIRDIGYTKEGLRFDADSCAVINVINEQSQNIAQGVDKGGAGDQGMMFGYACTETDELMPAPIMYAHKIVKELARIRKLNDGTMPYLRPDSKSQVTLEYSDSGEILRVDTIVVSTQHEPGITSDKIKEDIQNYIIPNVVPEKYLDNNTKYHVNPTGTFEIGGPHGDTGLTGRKIIVDTYGGRAPHGGGAFSGKDASKVDRSGAYAARHIAKNIVASGLARQVIIQLSYAIGVPQPVSIHVDTNGKSDVSNYRIAEFIKNKIDLRPAAIIERLDLIKPVFRQTSVYGHFGREEFTWEKLDLVDLFKTI